MVNGSSYPLPCSLNYFLSIDAVGDILSRYNAVPNLLALLSYNILDSSEKFSIILTLGHCTDGCGKILVYFTKFYPLKLNSSIISRCGVMRCGG